MSQSHWMTAQLLAAGFSLCIANSISFAQSPQDRRAGITVLNTTLGETNQKTPEVSTEELRAILAKGNAILLDTRPHLEWAISHIPEALNVAPKPGMPMSLYTSDVAEVRRLTNDDKSRMLILYCNGLYCGKSKRVAEDLVSAGYTNVRRYQLGAPMWRALGGPMAIELDGIRYVFQNDKTAVFIDAREAEAFQASTLPGARNIARSKVLSGKDVGEVKAAKDDGRLPMEDHNTRVIVFGVEGHQAREVAAALAREAFHNVSYFNGRFEEIKLFLQQ